MWHKHQVKHWADVVEDVVQVRYRRIDHQPLGVVLGGQGPFLMGVGWV